ncbi:MAG TPA: shikimate kinase [Thermoplasmata archaeon]|nr:shikimate kinase [Thermoplasmata archaeon]
MKGEGVANGGISFLNALFTGVGATAGIELRVRAWATSGTGRGVEMEGSADTPIARSMVERASELWHAGTEVRIRAGVESEIPPRRGLKSSSAVCCALGRAVARLFSSSAAPSDIAEVAASVALATGQSATGAYDDCRAALEPGIHVTDNSLRRELRVLPTDPDWVVTLLVPPGTHPSSPEFARRLSAHRRAARRVVELLESDRALEAMERNSELVERSMGYPYAGLRERLREAGALASGVSGLGPALAVISTQERSEAVRTVLRGETGALIDTRFTTGSSGADSR